MFLFFELNERWKVVDPRHEYLTKVAEYVANVFGVDFFGYFYVEYIVSIWFGFRRKKYNNY